MEALDLKKSGEHWKAKSSITANGKVYEKCGTLKAI